MHEHALKVWDRSEMKTVKDHHDLYLECDVLLLADVFQKIRNSSLKNYGLSLSHYLSAPALSWDGMLNMTKVELELISDADSYLFFEKGMKGGVTCISKRYSEANNKYLKSYDPKQESKHIIYLDANNLYCYAISKYFPMGVFKWIDPKEFDINKYICNTLKGCVLEFDLEYHKELKKLHNDYPLPPDEIEIKKEMLSKYQLKISDFYNIPIGNVKNWCLTFLIKKSTCSIMRTCKFM